MKLAYKLFHLPRDSDRNKLVEQAHMRLLSGAKIFDSETYRISNKEDYLNFKSSNEDFIIDPNGYSLNGEQGWKWGEIGIWASNWSSWKQFLDSDYDYLILMEDDIVIYEDFFELLKKYILELPEKWEAFHMFSPEGEYYKYNTSLDISENTCIAYQDWSCACYVINKSGVKKMLEHASRGIGLPIDWYMFRQKDIFNVYTIKPSAKTGCTVEAIESTFQNKQKRERIDS